MKFNKFLNNSLIVFCFVLLDFFYPWISSHNTIVLAKEIKIAIGMSLPPYVIKKDNTGIEVEIIQEALKSKGHTATFFFLPNLRIPKFLIEKRADGIAANSAYDVGKDINQQVYPTESTIIYQNFAISLAENQFVINSIKDLKDKKIIAFNNATKYLGPLFASVAEKNQQYEENANQSQQVFKILTKSSDVAISDKNIFLYWKNEISNHKRFKSSTINQSLIFHPIFPPAPRNCTFIDNKIRDEFNEGLEIIHKNGIYQSILNKYDKLYNIKQ